MVDTKAVCTCMGRFGYGLVGDPMRSGRDGTCRGGIVDGRTAQFDFVHVHHRQVYDKSVSDIEKKIQYKIK